MPVVGKARSRRKEEVDRELESLLRRAAALVRSRTPRRTSRPVRKKQHAA